MNPYNRGKALARKRGRAFFPVCERVSAREEEREEQQTESSLNVADDIFDFAEKDQLFSSSSRYPTDCVIILKDDKEVHVQKSLMSLHSEYFEELFAKNNSDKVVLSTVDHDEIVELLCAIYPPCHPITTRNVEALSKLAHQFKMPDLLKRCDVFLMTNNTKLTKSKLLLIAQEYDLKRLQAHYVKEYKSIRDVQAIQHEPEYASLNYHTRRMLLDNIVEANPLSQASSSIVTHDYYDFSGFTYGHAVFDDENDYGNIQLSIAPVATLVSIAPAAQTAFKILEVLASSAFCPSDIVLIVEDIEIHAHKQYLSVYSQYFYTMFQSKFKESHENVVVIEGIGYLEILELLSVIYPTEYSITDTNIGTILKLADRFIMPAVLTRCKKVLKSTNTIKRELKLLYAQQYNFADLQEEFAHQYRTIADVQRAKSEPEFEELDDKTRALILDSITEQNRFKTN